ncbi:helix-turn-helix domain-containing protein [Polaribacter cellanae]|uniref:Helix-turn-helix domain-containing protein n=1 Tax=Polaribacter cellanae TaxID=2818493 RepID=A0A975CRG5_9FLAO|nr:helix-turn-helix domain-containing protein [Polaribacter cellanae]QTE24338.1 helix-turn-helix domain-containing protein [Polaribacter cellanae]
MIFIHNENFRHSFYKDVTRINYIEDMSSQLISDYGYTYIMLRYGNIEAFNNEGKKVEVPKVFIKGTGDYFTVKAYKNSSWLSFELPNHILHNVTKIHSFKNRNKLIDLSLYVDDDVVKSMYENLREVNSIEEITKIADQHLRENYKDWSVLQPSVEIVQYILDKKGMLAVKELSDFFPYTERSIERMFKKEVGASPYRFICLVRFNYIIRELEKKEHKSLSKLIADYDYYDQSHFEKDFQKFLGQSIRDYKNDYNPLLTNGLSRAYIKRSKY